MASRRLIVGNWKMNPASPGEARRILGKMRRRAGELRRTELIICPPAPFLSLFARGGSITLGAQDVSPHRGGAHTGGISPAMLRSLGVEYSIVGHSERREDGDTDEIIAQKIAMILEYRLKPILCVGERERDGSGAYLKVIRGQIESALRKIPKPELKLLVIAYEPLWAIGVRARDASTPEDFLEQSIYIRKVLSGLTDNATALRVPVLYGGSVDAGNTSGFLGAGRAHGLLVGRSSLDPREFGEILRSAEES